MTNFVLRKDITGIERTEFGLRLKLYKKGYSLDETDLVVDGNPTFLLNNTTLYTLSFLLDNTEFFELIEDEVHEPIFVSDFLKQSTRKLFSSCCYADIKSVGEENHEYECIKCGERCFAISL